MYFVGSVQGYENLWIFGDEFASNTLHDFILQADRKAEEARLKYMLEHFNVKYFTNNQYSSHDKNILSRFHNLFTTALKTNPLLPKGIVLVTDDDMIRSTPYEGEDVQITYTKILQWITKEFYRISLAHKEKLPNKARRYKYPAFIWIAPPLNVNFLNNDLRRELTLAMESVASKYNDFWCLQLKKVWEYDNPSYYDDDCHRFTAKGVSTYWNAVDSTVKFWNTNLNHKPSKIDKKTKKTAQHTSHWLSSARSTSRQAGPQDFRRSDNNNFGRDRYHWSH